MKKYFKEGVWFGAILIPCLFFLTKETFAINLDNEGTYYEAGSVLVFSFALGSIGLILYLLRVLFNKFNSDFLNLLLIIFCLIMTFNFIQLVIINEQLTVPGGWVIYPPLSSPPVEIEEKSYVSHYSLILVVFIPVIVSLYTAYRMGINMAGPAQR